ncbi:ZIP family metal transporter [Stakelama saccharophila]|uniref:Transporter n=1 Tax=Stakelama saccharophila TaxID=3075605 RepID=A0ABZ0B9H5_9SPHN|nr:transporter [Stakelama sp. W311]WNO53498.1 transporter [Stakelama sp. W311]
MQALTYTLIPLAALAIGALTTLRFNAGPLLRSAVQHLAAGVVFAAAAGEILPDVKHGGSLLAVIVGALTGIAAMLLLKAYSSRTEGATGLAVATGLDLAIDGLVLGLGFVVGARQGMLLTIALTLEVLFLGLTLVGAFAETLSRGRAVLMTMLVGLALPIGALLGQPIAALPEAFRAGCYAFGLMALLYLVTEELLVEAHEKPETPVATGMFFLGFLAILVIEELMRG